MGGLSGRITPESLQIKSGNITGAPGIRKAIDQALDYNRSIFLEELHRFISDSVPMRTGYLRGQMRAALTKSSKRSFRLACPNVSYAGYVDDMTPHINWTFGDSVYHFFQKYIAFAEHRIKACLVQALKHAGVDVLAGASATQLAGEMIV